MQPDIGVFGTRQSNPDAMKIDIWNKSGRPCVVTKVVMNDKNVLKQEIYIGHDEGVTSRIFPTISCELMIRISEDNYMRMQIAYKQVDKLEEYDKRLSELLIEKEKDFTEVKFTDFGIKYLPFFSKIPSSGLPLIVNS